MRVAVVGPGALGCLLATLLHEGGLDVVVIDHREERAARLDRAGLRFRERSSAPARRIRLAFRAGPAAAAAADLVVLCTKAQHTRGALAGLAPALAPRARAWSVQNGLGNLELLVAALGERRALGGTTAQGACWDDDGALRHAGAGPTCMGAASGPPAAEVEALARALSAAGLPVEPVVDARREIWKKALVAASLLPLTALHGVPNGGVADRPSLRAEAEDLLAEGLAVAAGQGIALDAAEVRGHLWAIVAATAENRSSMLCDVLAGRETEVEALSGALARLGPAPHHARVAALVRALHPRDVS